MRTAAPSFAPKSKVSDAEVDAYRASAHGKLQAWLAFEAWYLESLEED